MPPKPQQPQPPKPEPKPEPPKPEPPKPEPPKPEPPKPEEAKRAVKAGASAGLVYPSHGWLRFGYQKGAPQDRYRAIPGDDPNAATRWSGAIS